MIKYIFILAAIAFFSTIIPAFSQEIQPVEMADTMRSNGKIYVVVAVVVTLFLGIIFYLVSLDKKITKLERESNQG